MSDPTQRFSSRVENYINYRPGYPPEVVAFLREKCALAESSVIADLGSGTGILAEIFLQNGNRVFGVEPNDDMREAGERLLAQYDRFTSITGTAESTTLEDRSVDFVTAGQAFHWFNRAVARKEFARILRPQGWVVLIWNERQTVSTPFLSAYEHLLHTYSTDYAAIDHRNIDLKVIESFFNPDTFSRQTFNNKQVFDFDGLKGRLLSSSYTPEPGHPDYQPMLDKLAAIYKEYQVAGKVDFLYDTNVYCGHLTERTTDD